MIKRNTNLEAKILILLLKLLQNENDMKKKPLSDPCRKYLHTRFGCCKNENHKKKKSLCDFCKYSGTRETCQKIHEKLPNCKSKGKITVAAGSFRVPCRSRRIRVETFSNNVTIHQEATRVTELLQSQLQTSKPDHSTLTCFFPKPSIVPSVFLST